MAIDSSFEFEKGQTPIPGSDEPSLDPENPNDLDPLRRPADPGTDPEDPRPDDWKDPPGDEMPAADEQAPLSDDLR